MAHALIVDAANVVGSKPDGWWRDRAGAARRLLGALAKASLDVDGIIVVLEGQAKKAAPLGPIAQAPQVIVVHAPGEGDDHIVAQAQAFLDAGHDVSVATNDRELRERVQALGAAFLAVCELRKSVAY